MIEKINNIYTLISGPTLQRKDSRRVFYFCIIIIFLPFLWNLLK